MNILAPTFSRRETKQTFMGQREKKINYHAIFFIYKCQAALLDITLEVFQPQVELMPHYVASLHQVRVHLTQH